MNCRDFVTSRKQPRKKKMHEYTSLLAFCVQVNSTGGDWLLQRQLHRELNKATQPCRRHDAYHHGGWHRCLSVTSVMLHRFPPVVLAQRSLLRHPLVSDVHVHFELDEILRTLRCIDNQIGALILRVNAPNLVRRDLVPTKLHLMILAYSLGQSSRHASRSRFPWGNGSVSR